MSIPIPSKFTDKIFPCTFFTVLIVALSAIVENYLILYWNFPADFVKFFGRFFLFCVAVYLLINLNLNCKNTLQENSLRLLAIGVALFIFNVSISMAGVFLQFRKFGGNNFYCKLDQFNLIEFVGTGLLSPTLETIFFVIFLPTIFIRQFRGKYLFIGIIFIAMIFAILHVPKSYEEFLFRTINAISFCFMWLGVQSIFGALLLHICGNVFMLILGYFFQNSICLFMGEIASIILIWVMVFGITCSICQLLIIKFNVNRNLDLYI